MMTSRQSWRSFEPKMAATSRCWRGMLRAPSATPIKTGNIEISTPTRTRGQNSKPNSTETNGTSEMVGVA